MFTHITVLALVVLASLSRTSGRSFAVVNNCKFTVWPAVFTGDTSHGKPDRIASQGGWELPAGNRSDFDVPDAWTAGRIWARTGCDFSQSDVSSCITGACLGGLHCTNSGIPPVTLAEFTLVPSGKDNYDVSNVDGSNIPMSITATGCPTASCPVDLNTNCPGSLQHRDDDNNVVGCASACKQFGGDNNCCTGAHNTRQTCPSSGVQYYDYFADNCPDAYAYAYDDDKALKSCSGTTHPVYTVTFCPSS